MSSLKSFTLQSPGTLGLNTQDNDTVQDPRYATEALNCVISKNGLLEARKGGSRLNASAATGTPDLDVVYSYVTDAGVEHIISAGGNKLWTGTTSLTDKTGALTVTNDNWQFHNCDGEVFGYNDGSDAGVYWDGGAGAFLTIASKGTAASVPTDCYTHLYAYGRSWYAGTTNKSIVYYSDLLIPEAFTGGSSGNIDLNSVWSNSNDVIVALSVHNNNLVIFCERSIVIYGNADNISNIYLVEVVSSNGCIARDSIQTVGNDIFYLANDGVRSLSRTVLQDNMPLAQISAPIRDDLIVSINGVTDYLTVRSVYNEQNGFYLLNFPGDKIYCCDVRLAEQGVFRWTTWDLTCGGVATGISSDDELYFGLNGGFVGKYTGYYDTDTSAGTVDQTYQMKFRSAWIDSGVQTMKCIWKKIAWTLSSKENIQATITWAFDFISSEKSQTKALSGAGASKYGSFKYGSGTKFGGESLKRRFDVNLMGTGSVIKIGFQTVIDGGKVAFNRADVFFKTGRIR